MMRALVVVLLAGCAAQETAPPTVSQAVAEAPCKAAVPPRPVFPTEALTGKEDLWTIATTLWADHKARRAYELQLETIVDGCTRAR